MESSLPNFLPNLTADSLVTLVFLFIVLIYVIFSIVFHYHWITYSVGKKAMSLTFLIYAAITLPLLFLLGIMTFTI